VVHRLTLQRGDSAAFVLEGAATPVDPAPVRIGAPLRGEWLAANGPSNASGHRRTPLALNGAVAIAQRFGIDFLQVDSSDRTFRGDSTNNANYLAYGEEILAVGDGIVVATKDSIPENTPRSPVARAVPITLETVGGNHIVIDLGGGHYAFYAHVQPGSLRVRAGDRVRRGQVIALVGNSGNSTEPHLHFHIVDGIAAGTSTLGAEGLPYELASFDLDGRCSIGVTGVRCARERPTTVNRGMPLQNQLVRFRD
jgi:murein DD-endopeptidase MepM/ murein hydrolase activator NlpD